MSSALALHAADVASAPLRSLLTTLDERGLVLDSLQVLRHGRLAFDYWRWPHDPDRRHTLHSATKSFTGTAVGLAVDEGLLALDDRVAPFFADGFGSEPSTYMREMRIRDLLTMQSGNTREISGATTRLRTDAWVNDFIEEPVGAPPGTHFQYSSMSSHVLSAIVGRVTGVSVEEYLRPRLFEPLGIEQLSWQRDPAGVSSGGNGLSLRPIDFLKFGQLYLQRGVWEGRQVLPEWWVGQASFAHVPRADPQRGYGFQFWVFPSGAYGAWGRFGQACFVFPHHDAVVATTAAIGDEEYGQLTSLLLDTFTEAFEAGATSSGEDASWLDDRVARARQATLVSSAAEPVEAAMTFSFPFNERGLEHLEVETTPDRVVVQLRDERGEHRIVHGRRSWHPNHTGVSVWRLHHSYQDDQASVLASAEWPDERILTLRWLFVESPFEDTITLEFSDDGVSLRHRSNVNGSDTELPPLRGMRRTVGTN